MALLRPAAKAVEEEDDESPIAAPVVVVVVLGKKLPLLPPPYDEEKLNCDVPLPSLLLLVENCTISGGNGGTEEFPPLARNAAERAASVGCMPC